MKKMKLLLYIALMALVCNSCTKDESVKEPDPNTFSFDGKTYNIEQTLTTYGDGGTMLIYCLSKTGDESAPNFKLLLTGCTSNNIPVGEYPLDMPVSGYYSDMKNMTYNGSTTIGGTKYPSKNTGKVTVRKEGNVYEILVEFDTDKGKTVGKIKGEFTIKNMSNHFTYKGIEYPALSISRGMTNPNYAYIYLSSDANSDAAKPWMELIVNRAVNKSFEAGSYTYEYTTTAAFSTNSVRKFDGGLKLNNLYTSLNGGSFTLVKMQNTSNVTYAGTSTFTTEEGTGEVFFMGTWATKKSGAQGDRDELITIQDKIELLICLNKIK